ncbi:hypothetical protein BZA70DRAFT_280720 [Myxozyma melibiosi]|uniref:GATA-type domain-containing protein n=1 Tax=Myxozyma melibiosi TaxID=54550 RepID=A0ABR1F5Q0_9ASCO
MDLFDLDAREYDIGPEYFAASLSALPLDDHRPRSFDSYPSSMSWNAYSPLQDPLDPLATPILLDQFNAFPSPATPVYVSQQSLPTPALSTTAPSLLHVVSPQGHVIFASQTVTEVLGYSPAEFVGKHLSEYVAADDYKQLARELNRAVSSSTMSTNEDLFTRASREKISDSARVLLTCRLICKDGHQLLVQISGHASFSNSASSSSSSSAAYGSYHSASYSPGADSNDDSSVDSNSSDDYRQFGRLNSLVVNTPASSLLGEFKGFVLTARPYSSVLSSSSNNNSNSNSNSSSNTTAASLALDSFLDHKIENLRVKQVLDSVRANKTSIQVPSMIPEELPSSDFSMLTNFAAAAAPTATHSRRHSAGDVLGSSQIRLGPSIAGDYLGSGLPRSKSISTTDHRIAKKQRLMDDKDYKCKQCGTFDSPEWRKGPEGPKTLCNACGLRWSKSMKRSKLSGMPPK